MTSKLAGASWPEQADESECGLMCNGIGQLDGIGQSDGTAVVLAACDSLLRMSCWESERTMWSDAFAISLQRRFRRAG